VSTALAADRLGVPSVLFFVMSAATPLTVVAGVVTTGFAITGLIGIPFAFVVVALVLALFSVGYVAMATYLANAGAFYAYISQGLFKPLGVGGAWVALLAYNALQVGLYGAIGAAAAPVLHDWFSLDVAWWVVALVAWALVAVLGLQQIDVNGKILAVLLVTEVAVIVLFSVADLFHPAGGTITFDTLAPGNLFGPGIGAILALAMLGFVGFESSVVFSEEARDPRRTVRIATFLSVGIIGVLYAFASWAMSVATGPHQIVAKSQSDSTELIFNLAQAHLGGAIVEIGRVLFVTSLVAAMISFHNTTARYMFALGRERVLPAALGRTSRTGSPMIGSLIQTAIGFVVIVLYAVTGADPLIKLFFWCGTSGGLGVLFLIATTSISVVVFFFRTRNDENLWRRLIAPALASVALLVVVYLALSNFATLLGVTPDDPLRWLIPVLYLVVAVLGILWGLTLRSRRPEVYATIGLGAKSAVAAVAVAYDAEEAAL
jgi:amino acid transporter